MRPQGLPHLCRVSCRPPPPREPSALPLRLTDWRPPTVSVTGRGWGLSSIHPDGRFRLFPGPLQAESSFKIQLFQGHVKDCFASFMFTRDALGCGDSYFDYLSN